MTKLYEDQTKANIISHMKSLGRTINVSTASVDAAVTDLGKLVAYMKTEAVAGLLVDADDANRLLDDIQTQATAYQSIATDLQALADLKGANDTQTASNIDTHITNISYNHAEYSNNFT